MISEAKLITEVVLVTFVNRPLWPVIGEANRLDIAIC